MTGKIVGYGDRERYFVDGKPVTKAEFDLAFPEQDLSAAPGGRLPGCWPLASEAAAVHPRQVAEARESARKKGVPTEFDGLGRPLFTGRSHRKKYLKAYGFRDRDGGYGD